MNCQETHSRLAEFLDRELSPEVAERLQQHLDQCPACARELATYRAIDAGVIGVPVEPLSVAAKERMGRAISQHLFPKGALSTSPRRSFWIPLAASLAAAALLLVSLALWLKIKTDSRLAVHPTADHQHPPVARENRAGVGIDYQKLLRVAGGMPQVALDELSRDLVAVSHDAAMQSHQSRVQAGQLVSRRVFRMPQCKCRGGDCHCGPDGCLCAASLGRRADGSNFLIVEHCETQEISFGDLPSEHVATGPLQFDLVGNGDPVAMTMVADHRRFTVLGIRGREEAAGFAAIFAADE